MISSHVMQELEAVRQVLHYLPSCPKTDAGWTMEEQELFWEAITEFPHGPWTSIAAFIGTKSTRQAMTHGQKLRQKLSRWKKRLRRRAPTTDPDTPDQEMPQLMQLPSSPHAPMAPGRSTGSASASTSPSDAVIRRSHQPTQQQHYNAHVRIKHSPPRPSLEISPPMPTFQHSDLTLDALTAAAMPPYSVPFDATIVWPSAIATSSSSDCHSMAMYSMPLDICTPTSTEMVPTFAAPYGYSSYVMACGTVTSTASTPTSRQTPVSYVTPPAPVFATLPRSMTDVSRGPVYMDDQLLSQSAMDDLAQALWDQ